MDHGLPAHGSRHGRLVSGDSLRADSIHDEAATTMRRWTGSRRRAWCRLVSCTRSRPVRARCRSRRRARRRRGRRRSGRCRRGRTHARRRSSGIRAAAHSRISSLCFPTCRAPHDQRPGYHWRGGQDGWRARARGGPDLSCQPATACSSVRSRNGAVYGVTTSLHLPATESNCLWLRRLLWRMP